MSLIHDFPKVFKQNVLCAFPSGAEWLESLPELLSECESHWNLKLSSPFTLSYNYVAPAVTTAGLPVVVKLGVPNPDFTREIQALTACAGNAAVELLDSDADRGMMLLEQVMPGHTLASLDDDETATREAARVMRDLWRLHPSKEMFPSAKEWSNDLSKLRQRFGGGTGPFPAKIVDRAEGLFRDLFVSSAEPLLLHGDLHHGNILAGQRRPWIAIDPKGVAAEPSYEAGALLRNPEPRFVADTKIQRRRIEILHDELGFAKERMLSRGVAQAVLAAWWSFEDSGTEWRKLCACAETLATVLAEC